jgi:uncharacterized protein YaiI (UPF0178 family)
LHIYVDADACPVKQETYRVARRHHLPVTLVAASWMRVPEGEPVHLHVVEPGFDSADDWIVAQLSPDDIVITSDIPLAARCLERGARVLGTGGRPFTPSNIGDALSTRNLLAEIRGAGLETGGPAPMAPRDRSRFLQALDQIIHEVLRSRK